MNLLVIALLSIDYVTEPIDFRIAIFISLFIIAISFFHRLLLSEILNRQISIYLFGVYLLIFWFLFLVYNQLSLLFFAFLFASLFILAILLMFISIIREKRDRNVLITRLKQNFEQQKKYQQKISHFYLKF